jgi:hypothetical protein
MAGLKFGLNWKLSPPNPNVGIETPWLTFGGLALRVGGQILRVTSKALAVENPND